MIYANHPAIVNSSYSQWHLEKLQKIYEQHESIIIGVDFDHTIRCPIEKHFYSEIVDILQLAYSKGHDICIWTANQNPELVKEQLKEVGIYYTYFNDSPLKYKGRKAHFNILLDDVAGLNEAYNTLNRFLKEQQ